MRRARERVEVRTSLRAFVRAAYEHLNTGTSLAWGWYLDAVCEFLQAIIAGEIPRGIINMRNRSLKSVVASVCAHPFVWLTHPETRFLTGGYDGGLAVEHCWAARQLIYTDWYQSLKQHDWSFTDDQNQKSFYANTLGGRRISTQVGGATGKGAHVIIIDDPLSIDQSYSDAETDTANRWFFKTILGRLDDPKNQRVALIQHRLRPDDTSGVALKEDHGFVPLVLPLEYDPRKTIIVPEIGFEDPRKEPGELLCEERWGRLEVERDKLQFGDLFQAICNQRPEKRSTTLIKRDWIRIWGKDPLPSNAIIKQSWDLSTKGNDPTIKEKNKRRSKVGGLIARMSIYPRACYIQGMVHRFANYIEQKQVVRAEWDRWGRHAPFGYVEDESNGSALILELSVGDEERKEPGIPGIVGVNPTKKGGKYQRMAAIAQFVRAGNLYVPDPDAPGNAWVQDFIELICNFPNVEYDEIPDCLSQLLSEEWLPDGLNKPGEESSEDRAAMLLQIAQEDMTRVR